MSVKRLDTSKQLFIVSQRNQDLRVIPDSLLQNRQRSLGNFVFLELAELCLI